MFKREVRFKKKENGFLVRIEEPDRGRRSKSRG